jgi:hypothetical protein
MSLSEERDAERRHMILLAPLMIAANAIVFLGMLVLAAIGLNGGESLGIIPSSGDVNQQIVRDHLAESVPRDRYRIREWLPAAPLEGNLAATEGTRSPPVTEKGVAQRVKLAVYGPSGARQLDTVFWIQNGRVTRVTEADSGRAAQEL